MARPRLAEGLGLGRDVPGPRSHTGARRSMAKLCALLWLSQMNLVTPVRGWHERQTSRPWSACSGRAPAGRPWSRCSLSDAAAACSRCCSPRLRNTGPWALNLRVSLVGRDQVVQVRTRIGPAPQADDDVALDAGWPGRPELPDTRPPRCDRSNRRTSRARVRARPGSARRSMLMPAWLRLDAAVPGVDVRIEIAEGGRDLPRGLVPHGVASDAPVRVDDAADPGALTLDGGRDAVALGAGARKLARRRITWSSANQDWAG